MTSILRDTGRETGGRGGREPPAGAVDFDVHGVVGVRLEGASALDAAAVYRQIGPLQGTLTREPEIVVRFVERLPLSSPVRYLGLRDAGFTDDAFLVLQGAQRAPVRAQIAFEQIGRARCEIVCESGARAVPLLVPILNLTALAKGWAPVHASAFTYGGMGVLATGWAKGGKTEALLAFMAKGGRYVGDEWVYVSPDGERLVGLPEPIKIWEWHIPDLPEYRGRISRSDRSRWAAIKAASRLERALPGRVGRAGGGKLGRLLPLVERQLYVHVPPDELFGPNACDPGGPLDKVLLLVSHESDAVRVEPVAAKEVAERMVFSLAHEHLRFLAYYEKFRFAFPERPNPLLEDVEELERAALTRALGDKDAYAVYHPFPAPIPALFDSIRPLLDH